LARKEAKPSVELNFTFQALIPSSLSKLKEGIGEKGTKAISGASSHFKV
jgi:hypothetical protein